MKKSTQLGRRKFVKQASLVSLGFANLARCSATPDKSKTAIENAGMSLTGDGYLDLPEGFSYKIISRAGDKMTDGLFVPGRADGMGTFAGENGKVIIIRNHENSPSPIRNSAFGPENELLENFGTQNLYDAGQSIIPSLGGTTTMVYNENTQEVESQYLSLAGTNRNCAGGITPWNSWLTCEEDVTLMQGNVEKNHGYVFEVPASENIVIAAPKPIKEMGRFNHEAVAVDPESSIVFLTEDRGDGLLYRFIPNVKGKMHEGGKLQALAIKENKNFDTRNWDEKTLELNQQLEVEWVDLNTEFSEEDNLRQIGYDKGAARFARGEGMWYGDGEIFFACTNGGPKKYGQIFRYIISPVEGTDEEIDQPGKVELFAESEDKTVLHMCDNLTIAPWGDVFLCEDNSELNHIRGINKKGELYDFACNRSSTSEFAGLVFSPSGKTLFVNIQENGDTLAITGPWEKLQ